MRTVLFYILGIISIGVTIYMMLEGDDSGHQVAFIGGIIRAIGANKQRKRLQRQMRKEGDLGERQERIKEFKPVFEADRSGYDAYTQALRDEVGVAESEIDRADYNLITAGGRPAGDEMMRDENRRTTANTVSRALQTVGGGSDALAALAIADAQERAGNRQIDIQSAQRIEQAQQLAEANRSQAVAGRARAATQYGSALFDAANVNRDLDILEYQENELNPYLQAVQDERDLEAAINMARGQTVEGWASSADDLFNAALSIYGMNKKSAAGAGG